MAERCPNCGSGEMCKENILEKWCAECGTLFFDDGSELHVPHRSRPAEVLEQITGNKDWWWRRDHINEIAVDGWIPIYAPKDWVSNRGQYVRAVPPIVAPNPKPAISDADVIKFLRGCYWMAGSSAHIEGPRPTDADVERVVAKVSKQPANVKPEVKDAMSKVDAQFIREFLRRGGGYYPISQTEWEKFCRIADRLERLAGSQSCPRPNESGE